MSTSTSRLEIGVRCIFMALHSPGYLQASDYSIYPAQSLLITIANVIKRYLPLPVTSKPFNYD